MKNQALLTAEARMRLPIGVYEGGALHVARVEGVDSMTRLPLTTDDTATATALVGAARAARLRAVWIAAGALPETSAASWWAIPQGWRGIASGPSGYGEAPTGTQLRREDVSGGEVFIADIGRDSRWPWYREADPVAIARYVRAVERALSVPLQWSPAHTALDLLARTNENHREWLSLAPLPDVPTALDAAPSYSRALSALEARRKYIHLYDANAAYLAAARYFSWPCGEPSHTEAWDEKARGLWRVSVRRLARNLPTPIQVGGWHETASVRAALFLGHEITVHEGHVYRERHEAGRQWADALWSARVELAAPGLELARDAIKAMYTTAIGRFEMEGNAAYGPNRWHRPLWGIGIRAENARRVWWRYGELTSAGLAPFLAHIDTIGIVSDEPDPMLAAPALTDRATGLGGYKHDSTARITPEIAALAADNNAPRVVDLVHEQREG